jgi:prophage regulatory protein
MAHIELPADLARYRVLDTRQAASFCSISVPHFRRLHRAGRVPDPVRLTARKYGWRIGDLVDWIDANHSATDGRQVESASPPPAKSSVPRGRVSAVRISPALLAQSVKRGA